MLLLALTVPESERASERHTPHEGPFEAWGLMRGCSLHPVGMRKPRLREAQQEGGPRG